MIRIAHSPSTAMLVIVSVVTCMAGARHAAGTMGTADAEIAAALARVSAQCPETYAERVTPVPSANALADEPLAHILELLGYWNPAIRARAAAELSGRGDEVIAPLEQALTSTSPARRAGALDALYRMIRHRVQNWDAFLPDEPDRRVAQNQIRRAFADRFLDPALDLALDPEWKVRWAVLSLIGEFGGQSRAISRAVLAMSADTDEYLADMASRTLGQRVGVADLDEEYVIPFLRQALHNPLPRGKGPVVQLIARSDETLQRSLVPDLLALLDWQPDRDTMFGSNGQAEAIEILTELRVQELVPRLPALMDKPMRGPGLFEFCMDSIRAFGADARPILPELRERIAPMKAEAQALSGRTDQHSRRQAELLKERVETLREVVTYVEE